MSTSLEGFVEYFEHLSPEALGRLDTIYSAQARFSDPFNQVQGVEAIRRIFADMFERLEEPRFDVLECYVEGSRAMLVWEFRFRFRGESRPQRIEGCSRIEFDSAGRVCSHLDYWDAAGGLYAHLPLLGSLMRWLRRRVAAA